MHYFLLRSWRNDRAELLADAAERIYIHFSAKGTFTTFLVFFCLVVILRNSCLFFLILRLADKKMETIPKDMRNLRACLLCSLVKVKKKNKWIQSFYSWKEVERKGNYLEDTLSKQKTIFFFFCLYSFFVSWLLKIILFVIGWMIL